jgi:hypothetical protein
LLFEGAKFAVHLIEKELTFEVLEREVVELENTEISPHEEWIFIRL